MAARRCPWLALDVADELSDDFLAQIKKAVLAEKPDALLLGEVWEDASNKISYGHLRRYLQGSGWTLLWTIPSATWSSAF